MNLNTKNITGVIFGVSAVLSTSISPASGYESEIVQAHIGANNTSYSINARDTVTSGSSFDSNNFLGTSNYSSFTQIAAIESEIFDFEEDINIRMEPIHSYKIKVKISKITKATPKLSISELV